MRITLFDYGAGNLHSLAKALQGGNRVVHLETDPEKAIDTDVLVLPGVGAFGSASQALAPGREAMRSALAGGLPCLGICLGLQVMVVEYARSVVGLADANSSEFDTDHFQTPYPVIDIMDGLMARKPPPGPAPTRSRRRRPLQAAAPSRGTPGGFRRARRPGTLASAWPTPC